MGLAIRATLLIGLALVLGSCGGSKPIRAPCPAGKLCLQYGNSSEPTSLDPPKTVGTWEDRILGEMLIGLVQNDADGRPVPGMAKSWETSPDGLVWTFHLRDANWSDGVAVSADDYVFGAQRLMNPATASEYSYLDYVIKNAAAVNAGKLSASALGIKALGPKTVQITLEHPAPYLPELLKHQTMYPAPRRVVEKWGDAWTKPEHYVANGPYKLAEWRFGDHIRLVRNPAYYDAGKVCYDEVNFYPGSDAVSAERRVRRGELDVTTDIQSNRIAYLRRPDQIPGYVRVSTYLGTAYLVFNTRDVPAFRDRRVRIALDMAVDREFITKKLLRGGQLPAYTFTPPGVANYGGANPPVWASWSIERRQAAARALLAQAGYRPGHPLTFEYKHMNTPDPVLIAPAVQADWKAIGVSITLAQEDSQIAYQDYRLRNFQAGFTSWIADYNDATSFLGLLQSQTGAQNYGDYNNPKVDALLDKADHEPDAVKRAGYLRQTEAIVLDDAAVTPIYFYVSKNLVNPKITGWADNIVNWHRVLYLCQKR
jgi:oligopeptide transport system substrate-binding protein